jgi:hypothetical protein
MDRTERFLSFVALSIVLHVLLFWALREIAPTLIAAQKAKQRAPIAIRLVPANEFKGQIVKTQQRPTKEARPDAEYLAEQNSQVERETRARLSGSFKNVPQPGGRGGERGDPQSRRQLGDGDEAARKGTPLASDIVHSVNDLSRTYDYINRPEGDQTLLNTKEYIYAGFFNRIKEKVGPLWQQRIQDAVARGSSGLKATDYLTVLKVILSREGDVVDVRLTTASSVDFLDRAAIEAFWQAKRFDNPPKGLFKGQKTGEFDFSFLVSLSQGMFQYNVIPDDRFAPRAPQRLFQ